MEGMPGVFKVFYFGSTGLDIKYTPGKSDLNIIVFGNNIPGWVKKIGVLLIRDFNNKLRLGLDDTPIFHHTPVYVDSPSRMGAMLVLFKTSKFMEYIRLMAKQYGFKAKYPNGFIPTYSLYWRIVEKIPDDIAKIIL